MYKPSPVDRTNWSGYLQFLALRVCRGCEFQRSPQLHTLPWRATPHTGPLVPKEHRGKIVICIYMGIFMHLIYTLLSTHNGLSFLL